MVEPGAEYVHGWHIDAICEHLEAVADGRINRLLINVPPGMMKSLCVSVFFPAWEWCRSPHLRYLCASHSMGLAIRDSTKMRRLIQSEWYQTRWGSKVKLTGDQNAKTKFETSETGFREAVAAGSITGARGDRVIIDDPSSVESAASDAMRKSTEDWFLEAVPTRLNNPAESAIIVIMQRLHEQDVSGLIISKGLGYCHLQLPMEYDPLRHCETEIGFSDPRTEEGELIFPERFPREVVERDKNVMGPYAVAGQFQQTPTPRGGGIILRDWWRVWNEEEAAVHGVAGGAFPPFDYVVASLDGAYTEKQENDPSALTIWGVWQRTARLARSIADLSGARVIWDDDADTMPAAMLMHAWAKRLPILGPELDRAEGESDSEFRMRTQAEWGLVEHVADACKRFKVDLLLIEAKGPGLSVAQSIKRLNRYNDFGVRLIDPGRSDKVARAYAVQHIFSGGQVYAPDRNWADAVISEFEAFPRGAHDDLCLVAGTMIEMSDGSFKRIEEMLVGDSVATPIGPCLVSASGMTGERETIEIAFDGGKLEGTASHPIYSDDEWIRLDKLVVGSHLTVSNSLPELSACHSSRSREPSLSQLCSMVGNIIGIRIPKGIVIGRISADPVGCSTGMFGSSITVQFRQTLISIIKMVIRSTTQLATLSVSLLGSIVLNTKKIIQGMVRNPNSLPILIASGAKLPHGIALQKGVSGIASMYSRAYKSRASKGNSESKGRAVVNGAVLNSNIGQEERNFVRQHARIESQNTKLVSRVTCMNTTKPVYNLTVDGAHCYYANGVLVHNCDSTTQALRYLWDHGLLRRHEEVAQDALNEISRPVTVRAVYDV